MLCCDDTNLCYYLFDDFDDNDLTVSSQQYEVIWKKIIPSSTQQFPLPPSITAANGKMVLSVSTDKNDVASPFSAEPLPERFWVPNDLLQEFQVLCRGRYQFDANLQVETENHANLVICNLFNNHLLAFCRDGKLRVCQNAGNPADLLMSLPVDASADDRLELRFRIDADVWNETSFHYGSDYPSVRVMHPCFIYTQTLDADPDDDSAWVLRIAMFADGAGVSPSYVRSPAMSIFKNSTGIAGPTPVDVRPDGIKPQETTNIYSDPLWTLQDSFGKASIDNFNWSTIDGKSYGPQPCPTVENTIWPGFEWKNEKMFWSITEAASTIFDRGPFELNLQYVLADNKIINARPRWAYEELRLSAPKITKTINGTVYEISLYKAQVRGAAGMLQWQMDFWARTPVGTTPYESCLYYVWGTMNTVDVQAGEHRFPRSGKQDSMSYISSNYFLLVPTMPQIPAADFYNAVFGQGWTMRFSSE